MPALVPFSGTNGVSCDDTTNDGLIVSSTAVSVKEVSLTLRALASGTLELPMSISQRVGRLSM